ncbi:cell division protein DivIVA [Paucilactobacillus hokkaidonensis JCM 18461]|uniref:Cell division protein DivIVA n=2 Tax=Paucilactobacillus hokkaidonensis TaxID=1193095 RepID=A0A0A1GYC5_9LACO|nr:DivIVA domain-containing protein [Paucilactobacillus hokkaidonensis]KRO09928.1 cell division initiation protein [Paucilactobacillus hokkaidonensis]BAP85909.1 cell division protein DivIVA [Paucilactobacillus hokkaidonensis JCM 18461]
MSLTVDDIQNEKFATKMRGYNVEEVNQFLDRIVAEFKTMTEKNHELEETVKGDQEKLQYFTELKDSLNQSILVAQEAADKVKSNAQKEADITLREAQKQATDIVSEANEKANQLVHNAAESTKRLTVQTNDLKKQTRVFRQRLQVMLESQLAVVNSSDWDSLLQEADASSYDEIQKVLGKTLDNQGNQSVNSVSSSATAPEKVVSEKVENKVAADPGETVVIFPDSDQK